MTAMLAECNHDVELVSQGGTRYHFRSDVLIGTVERQKTGLSNDGLLTPNAERRRGKVLL